ncbi:cupredoxin domain-containing protein [Arthrobacter glacialis]|uniref:Copper-binding protein n=1 Tax=Arthrobacter glacialis TaxID=1664 RepID=A0A2S3ZWA8_ARTGL|nr:cupredoxin domain-containing protein [Arthrobacter glacialis]POH56776.1 copper-binding protein [Arthrobacter glacialis]POH73177.1 copper-binding protein [Arthrobacter glacialis]
MKANTRTGSRIGLAAAIAVLALSGCGNPGTSGADTTASPTPAEQFQSPPSTTTDTSPSTSGPGTTLAAAPEKILIKGFKYQGTETVSPGAEITVTNEDIEAHTITADTANAFDVNIQVGTTTFTAPTEPGAYPYHCNFHGNMKGTLTVK